MIGNGCTDLKKHVAKNQAATSRRFRMDSGPGSYGDLAEIRVEWGHDRVDVGADDN